MNDMTVLIPSYEPTGKLLELIEKIKGGTNYNILIVDDGSGEAYSGVFKTAENLGCIVITHNQNKGKGAALKTGFSYLHDFCPGENAVCADSDGQHCIDDIIKIAECMNEDASAKENSNVNEMILGVRTFDNDVPFKSKFGNRVTSFLFSIASGISLSDTQTGLRAYPFSMFEWLIKQKGERFEYELNLLLESKSAGISIKQIHIRTIYENANKSTHFRPLADSARVLAPIFKFFIKYGASSFTSAVIDFILLFAFQKLIGSLFFSVFLARIISSTYNYTVNRLIVFNAKKIPNKQSAPRYFLLAAAVMLLNYSLLKFLTAVLGIYDITAKILTELILVILTYSVQRLYVFNREHLKRGKD